MFGSCSNTRLDSLVNKQFSMVRNFCCQRKFTSKRNRYRKNNIPQSQHEHRRETTDRFDCAPATICSLWHMELHISTSVSKPGLKQFLRRDPAKTGQFPHANKVSLRSHKQTGHCTVKVMLPICQYSLDMQKSSASLTSSQSLVTQIQQTMALP